MSSKGVQAQRDGDDLAVYFDTIEFQLNAAGRTEAKLDGFKVKVYKKGSDGQLQLLSESNEHALGAQVNTSQPVVRERSVKLTVKSTGTDCDQSCLVTASADYSGVAGQAPSSAESAPVEIQLALAQTVQTTTVDFPTRQKQVGGCAWLSEAQASAAMGLKMKYEESVPGSTRCSMVPVLGVVIPLFFSVTDDAGTFYEFTAAPGAEMLSLGDRAVWLPRSTTLHVVEGRKMITVRIGRENAPHEDVRFARAKAEAIARSILEKL